MRLKSTIYESTLSTADAVPLPQWGRQIGGGFAEIDDEVAAVLAFVISSATFIAAQDDETGRCPKVSWEAGFPFGFPVIDYLNANEKDFSLALEMTIQESP